MDEHGFAIRAGVIGLVVFGVACVLGMLYVSVRLWRRRHLRFAAGLLLGTALATGYVFTVLLIGAAQ